MANPILTIWFYSSDGNGHDHDDDEDEDDEDDDEYDEDDDDDDDDDDGDDDDDDDDDEDDADDDEDEDENEDMSPSLIDSNQNPTQPALGSQACRRRFRCPWHPWYRSLVPNLGAGWATVKMITNIVRNTK